MSQLWRSTIHADTVNRRSAAAALSPYSYSIVLLMALTDGYRRRPAEAVAGPRHRSGVHFGETNQKKANEFNGRMSAPVKEAVGSGRVERHAAWRETNPK